MKEIKKKAGKFPAFLFGAWNGIVEYGKTNAWCHDCKKITYAEDLPTIDEIREEYEHFGVPGPPVKGIRALMRRFDRHYHETMLELSNTLTWREQRKNPPRCLECGMTNIVLLEFRNLDETSVAVSNFRHSCGGELVHDFSDMPGTRFSFNTKVIWVDSKGNVVDGPAESCE